MLDWHRKTCHLHCKRQSDASETTTLLPEYAHGLDEDPFERYDYCFEGIVLKVEQVSQYNGFGTDMPYTYFRVRILRDIKGQTDNEVIIKYYGGYDENGELVLLENAELPEIGEIYTFYCNRTNLRYQDDGRTLDGCYVVLVIKTSIGNVIFQRKHLGLRYYCIRIRFDTCILRVCFSYGEKIIFTWPGKLGVVFKHDELIP